MLSVRFKPYLNCFNCKIFGHFQKCTIVLTSCACSYHKRFSIYQKIRKFGLGCKWNTTFWFVPLQIFQNKRNSWKASPVFPVETSGKGKSVFHSQISRLYCFYHQFHTFRGLLSGEASLGSLEWNLWQIERAFPIFFVNGKRPMYLSRWLRNPYPTPP